MLDVPVHAVLALFGQDLLRMGLHLDVFGKCVERKRLPILLRLHRYTHTVIAHIRTVAVGLPYLYALQAKDRLAQRNHNLCAMEIDILMSSSNKTRSDVGECGFAYFHKERARGA
jgi:hypothetical protein